MGKSWAITLGLKGLKLSVTQQVLRRVVLHFPGTLGARGPDGLGVSGNGTVGRIRAPAGSPDGRDFFEKNGSALWASVGRTRAAVGCVLARSRGFRDTTLGTPSLKSLPEAKTLDSSGVCLIHVSLHNKYKLRTSHRVDTQGVVASRYRSVL